MYSILREKFNKKQTCLAIGKLQNLTIVLSLQNLFPWRHLTQRLTLTTLQPTNYRAGLTIMQSN